MDQLQEYDEIERSQAHTLTLLPHAIMRTQLFQIGSNYFKEYEVVVRDHE